MELPPFDAMSRCRKCGGWESYVRWYAAEADLPVPDGEVTHPRVDAREHLEHTCERCGFAWAEVPISEEEFASLKEVLF